MSTLEALFVGAGAGVSGRPAGHTNVLSADAPADLPGVCRTAAKHLCDGDRLLITFDLSSGGRIRRLATLLLLPSRVARLERELARWRFKVRRYAVGPTLSSPSLVFEIDTVAAAYAATHLENPSARFRRLRAVLRWWLSCDPSGGGIVVVAHR